MKFYKTPQAETLTLLFGTWQQGKWKPIATILLTLAYLNWETWKKCWPVHPSNCRVTTKRWYHVLQSWHANPVGEYTRLLLNLFQIEGSRSVAVSNQSPTIGSSIASRADRLYQLATTYLLFATMVDASQFSSPIWRRRYLNWDLHQVGNASWWNWLSHSRF